jgi:rhamnosyltransferase
MAETLNKNEYFSENLAKNSIACVLVFYQPSEDDFSNVVNLLNRKYEVIAVINQVTKGFKEKLSSLPQLHIIQNEKNIGLASGLNQGAVFAFQVLKAKYVIFFDQDSTPNDMLPQKLMEEFEACSCLNLACIGPTLIDRKSAKKCQVRNALKNNKSATMPTSGTLIPISTWYDVGPMLDGLFVDCIDHEWCFRAKSKGYEIRISSKIKMTHDMGELGINFMGFYKPIYQSPLRHYYIVRNTLLLLSFNYVPRKWISRELLMTIPRIIFYLYYSSNKNHSMKLILKGIWDGLRKKTGEYK